MRAIRWFPVILASAAVAACGGLSKPASTGNTRASTTDTAPADYPTGPYGYAQGSTIADLKFIGKQSVALNGSPDVVPMVPLRLSDYRDKYKVIVVLAAAGWCGPCNAEQPDMVQQFKDWNSANPTVAMVEVLVNNKTPGTPADESFVNQWASMYSIPFDLGTDPTGVLSPYYDISAFPMNMVIRTSDMAIMWQFNGENLPGLKGAVSYALNN